METCDISEAMLFDLNEENLAVNKENDNIPVFIKHFGLR